MKDGGVMIVNDDEISYFLNSKKIFQIDLKQVQIETMHTVTMSTVTYVCCDWARRWANEIEKGTIPLEAIITPKGEFATISFLAQECMEDHKQGTLLAASFDEVQS